MTHWPASISPLAPLGHMFTYDCPWWLYRSRSSHPPNGSLLPLSNNAHYGQECSPKTSSVLHHLPSRFNQLLGSTDGLWYSNTVSHQQDFLQFLHQFMVAGPWDFLLSLKDHDSESVTSKNGTRRRKTFPCLIQALA